MKGSDEERMCGGRGGESTALLKPSQGSGMSVCLLLVFLCLFAVLKNTESSQIADPLVNLVEVERKSLFAWVY